MSRTSHPARSPSGAGRERAQSRSKQRRVRALCVRLGHSRGGLTTKIHLAADARARPISRVITPGQRHDAVAFEPVMAGIRIRRRGRPDRVLGDKAYRPGDHVTLQDGAIADHCFSPLPPKASMPG